MKCRYGTYYSLSSVIFCEKSVLKLVLKCVFTRKLHTFIYVINVYTITYVKLFVASIFTFKYLP